MICCVSLFVSSVVVPQCNGLEIEETARRSLKKDKFLLVLLWGFAECGNHKALRLRAQGVYSCK